MREDNERAYEGKRIGRSQGERERTYNGAERLQRVGERI